MRVFIAIDLTEDVKNYLKGIQQQLPEAKLRTVKDFHLTLKFIGELTPERVERLKELLGEVKFGKFVVETAGIGVFPSEKYIRVVWIGLEPEEPLLKLQQQIEAVLAKEFRQEKNFKAHLTLARVKFVGDKAEFVRKLKEIKRERKKFVVERFILKKSTLTPEGPIYEDLAIYESEDL
jgi:2'-5' RNA ligase